MIFMSDETGSPLLVTEDGGLAAASTVTSTLRGEAAQRGHGCLFAVSANVAWADPLVKGTKGQLGLDLLNQMLPDVVVIGERQFVHGRQRLEQLISESSTQCWLAANVFPEGEPAKLVQGCRPFRVFELQCGGRAVRVGIVGVCDDGRCCGLDVGDPVVALRDAALAMRRDQGPLDVLIALTSLPWSTVRVQIPEIDVVLGGRGQLPARQANVRGVRFVDITLSPFGRPQLSWDIRSTSPEQPGSAELDVTPPAPPDVLLDTTGSGLFVPATATLLVQMLPGLFPQISVPLTGTLSTLSILWHHYRRSRARRNPNRVPGRQ
jgi:hypothetical protein